MPTGPIIVNNGNAAPIASINHGFLSIGPPSIRPFGLSTAHIVSNNSNNKQLKDHQRDMAIVEYTQTATIEPSTIKLKHNNEQQQQILFSNSHLSG